MRGLNTKLKWQFFLLYCGVIAFGMATVTADNLFVNGKSLQSLTEYNFKAITIQAFCAVLIFHFYTLFRLRPPLSWKRLTYFPTEIFWAMMIFALVTSPLFHIFDAIFSTPENRDEPWSIALSVISELTLCLILAILLFTLIRRLLRPSLLNFPNEEPQDFAQSTFVRPLMLSFVSLIFISVLRPIKYILFRIFMDKPIEVHLLILIALTTTIFSIILYLLLIWQFRDEMRFLIRGLLSLLDGDKSWLKRKIPIISTDEVGQLAIAFNTLQGHITRNYQEVQREMELAYQVQQKILPPPTHELGAYKVAALCQPAKEVGGDFYDLLTLDKSRFAIITGDVSGKGMPAALAMSAVLVLFRSEARRGGTAGEILTRLNKAIADTLQGSMFITLGLGIIDQQENTLEYSSAGHMSPYILREETLIPIPSPSLPLGIMENEVYQETLVSLYPQDRFISYTDGVVEALDHDGNLYGFANFERSLVSLNPQLPPLKQVQNLLHQLPESNLYDDDRTILLLKFVPSPVPQG